MCSGGRHTVDARSGERPRCGANRTIGRADRVNRRALVRTIGFGWLVGIPGCAALRGASDGDDGDGGDGAGDGSAQPDLRVAAVDPEWTSSTRLTAEVDVANGGNARGSATLYFEVEVDAGGTYTKSEPVSVAPGDRETYTFEVEIDPSESMGAEGAETRAWLEG